MVMSETHNNVITYNFFAVWHAPYPKNINQDFPLNLLFIILALTLSLRKAIMARWKSLLMWTKTMVRQIPKQISVISYSSIHDYICTIY